MNKPLQNKDQSKDIDRKVERTLELAENLEKQEVKPHFYTRVMARIEKEKRGSAPVPAFMGFSRKFAMGIVGLLLIVNSLTVYFTFSGGNIPKSEFGNESTNGITREEYLEQAAGEYFGGAGYYNY